jgi:signal transduction histidine kinase
MLQLSPAQNALSVQVGLLHFTQPSANRLEYRLEPVHSKWISTTERTLRFAAMKPGAYTLRMRGIGPSGLPGPEKVLQFRIQTAFWERPLVQAATISVVLTLLSIAGYLAHRRRLEHALEAARRQQALEAERNRISQDLHDELGTTIAQIGLITTVAPFRENKETVWDEIGAAARRATQSMNEIVWTLHSRNDGLAPLLAYLREAARDYLESVGIAHTVEFPDDIPEGIPVSGELRRAVLLVTKEALSNAARHSSASHIHLTCAFDGIALTIRVSDNGIGIDTQVMRQSGNGLHNMRKRVEALGGKITWTSMGRGTEVAYCVPLAQSEITSLSHPKGSNQLLDLPYASGTFSRGRRAASQRPKPAGQLYNWLSRAGFFWKR